MPVPGFNRPGDGGTGLSLTQKLNLVNAIGLPATMADSFQTLVNRVSNKKRWASGTGTDTSSSQSANSRIGTNTTSGVSVFSLTISGLTFTPTIIHIFTVNSAGYPMVTTYYANASYYGVAACKINTSYGATTSQALFFDIGGNFYVSSTGFCLPMSGGGGLSCNWIAIE